MGTYELETKINHDGSIKLPTKMKKLRDHQVKIILIDLEDKKEGKILKSIKGSFSKTGFNTQKYFAQKQQDKELE